ncbi:Uncharacterised protein [Mycobacteroides abscessus subsp. abscessus]|nr:Uncharacterised protein [Mycobacteroides abscessus subsp. abscessus]
MEIAVGPNDAAPSMVVLFEPARSAEPPHSSGRMPPSAESTLPDAARVARSLSPGAHVGITSRHPSGSSCACRRSNSFLFSGLALAQASNAGVHDSLASIPRSTSLRVWLMTSSETSKFLSGSNPRASLVLATSSAPRAEPWMAPVFILSGAG